MTKLLKAVQSVLDSFDGCPDNIDSAKWDALAKAAAEQSLTKEITLENQHAITINATKTTIELPEGDKREVNVWFRSINDEGGLHLCIDVSNEKSECPLFDHFNYEPILEWAKTKFNASVTWSDIFYSGKDLKAGKKIPHKHPEWAHWSLSWNRGVIGFDLLVANNKETEQKARQTAALFIYLYAHGVDTSVALHCAEEYVKHVHLEPVK